MEAEFYEKPDGAVWVRITHLPIAGTDRCDVTDRPMKEADKRSYKQDWLAYEAMKNPPVDERASKKGRKKKG